MAESPKFLHLEGNQSRITMVTSDLRAEVER